MEFVDEFRTWAKHLENRRRALDDQFLFLLSGPRPDITADIISDLIIGRHIDIDEIPIVHIIHTLRGECENQTHKDAFSIFERTFCSYWNDVKRWASDYLAANAMTTRMTHKDFADEFRNRLRFSTLFTTKVWTLYVSNKVSDAKYSVLADIARKVESKNKNQSRFSTPQTVARLTDEERTLLALPLVHDMATVFTQMVEVMKSNISMALIDHDRQAQERTIRAQCLDKVSRTINRIEREKQSTEYKPITEWPEAEVVDIKKAMLAFVSKWKAISESHSIKKALETQQVFMNEIQQQKMKCESEGKSIMEQGIASDFGGQYTKQQSHEIIQNFQNLVVDYNQSNLIDIEAIRTACAGIYIEDLTERLDSLSKGCTSAVNSTTIRVEEKEEKKSDGYERLFNHAKQMDWTRFFESTLLEIETLLKKHQPGVMGMVWSLDSGDVWRTKLSEYCEMKRIEIEHTSRENNGYIQMKRYSQLRDHIGALHKKVHEATIPTIETINKNRLAHVTMFKTIQCSIESHCKALVRGIGSSYKTFPLITAFVEQNPKFEIPLEWATKLSCYKEIASTHERITFAGMRTRVYEVHLSLIA